MKRILGTVRYQDDRPIEFIHESEAKPYKPETDTEALRRIACYIISPLREQLLGIANRWRGDEDQTLEDRP